MRILDTYIGFTNPETNEFVLQKAKGEAEEFLRNLLEYTLTNSRTREYQFRPEEEMAEIVLSFAQARLAPFDTRLDINLDKQLEAIVERLFDAENRANKRIGSTGRTVKTGSIVLALLQDDEEIPYFVFAKVDHTRYLEGEKLELQTGFPIEDRDIWKTAVVQLRKGRHISIGDVLVYMEKQATYWTDWFLGLTAKRTDAANTLSMYKAVCGVLKREVEKVSVNDYLILWHTFVQRINAEKGFDYNVFVDELLDEYTPQTDKLQKEDLKNTLLKLPKNNFDIQFNLDPRDIATMTKFQVIKLSPGIELRINSDVDVDKVISKASDSNGDMYIRIRCTDKKVYDKFH